MSTGNRSRCTWPTKRHLGPPAAACPLPRCPGFYLRRFFSDLLLHKQENGDIYRQETTFCPVPARNSKALTLLVLFPSGFAVHTAPDGRLRLDSADKVTPTGFIVRKPL